MAYAEVDSPLGPLYAAVTRRGLVALSYGEDEFEIEWLRLARLLSPRILRAPRRVDRVRRQLDEYFGGRRTSFHVDVDTSRLSPFQQRVLRELARVPYGRTTTYGALAGRAGRPAAARAVGTVMNRNPIPIVLPCHRVVGATGNLVGYGGGLERKKALLRLEGAIA